MIVSMKKLSRSFTPGLAQSFLICLTLLCWAEENHPVIIFALMFIVCVAIIRTKIPNKKTRLPRKFKQTQCISLFSSTIFMFTCFILFKTEYKEHLYTIILTIATIISMVLISRSHITSIDNKEKTLSSYTKTIIKYTWIVISLFSYNISRALISITFDIPFDSTNDRPITFLFSFFCIFWIYYSLYYLFLFVIFYLTEFVNSSRNKKSKTKFYPGTGYHLSVILPSFFIYIALSNVLGINIPNILKTGTIFTLRYEARDSFFCHNRYMFLTEHPDARFMLISEGSYRALIPHKDDINVFRLTCSDKEPFYSLNGVVDKDSLILTAIKERANILINDLYLK